MSDETSSSSQIKFSWFIGVLAAFVIFALIAGYSAHMTQEYPSYDKDRAEARYATLKKLQEDANKTLTTADWIDQAKGTVRIPITEAMAEEVETLKGESAQVGCEIVVPAAAPATPSTNAAPVKPGAPSAGTTNAAPVVALGASGKPAATETTHAKKKK